MWLPGDVEVLLLVVFVGVLVLPSLRVHGETGPAFTEQERTIDRLEAAAPVRDGTWHVQDLGFASAEVPGVTRRLALTIEPEEPGTEAATMDAVIIGGHGASLAIVALPAGDPGGLVQAQVDALFGLKDEFDLPHFLTYAEMVDFHPRPGSTYVIDQLIQLGVAHDHDLTTGEYSLRSEATYKAQTVRIRLAMVGEQPVLVVSLLPAGRPDPVIDRIARSLKPS